MLELSSSGKIYVTGRGNAYIIDLQFNNLPRLQQSINNVLHTGDKISIDGIEGTVSSIDCFAQGQGQINNKIGIYLKETNEVN